MDESESSAEPLEPSPPVAVPALSSSLPPTSDQPSVLHLIFIGPNGIRAGWRLLMFAAFAAVFVIVLTAPVLLLSRRTTAGGGTDPASVIVGDTVPFIAVLLAARVMAEIEGRSLADYGLPVRGAFGWRFWQGALWGFAALSAVLLAIAAAHGFSFGRLAVGGRDAVYYAIAWALAFLAVGFLEEFLMRGYAIYTLATGIGFWPSAVLLSVLFGTLHLYNRGENWTGAASAAFIGLFFCFTLRRTGDLWFAVGLHASWDYAQSFVYSVPDSGFMVRGHLLDSFFHGPRWLTGGSVGPEGSVLTFAVVAMLFLAFARLYRETRFPPAAKRRFSDPKPAINSPQPSSLGL